jgi:hypothetical protein
MEMTTRGLWTLMHGMGFGALYLLACSGALTELYFWTAPQQLAEVTPTRDRFLKVYLIALVVLAWSAVLTGTYVVYPWYRAVPPPGMTPLSMCPQRLLMSSPATSGWHSFGMEWKEHIAWLAPISITMVAYVFIRYGQDLRRHRPLRTAVLCFALVSFLAAGIAGLFGALIDKKAPVEGGGTIQLSAGAEK